MDTPETVKLGNFTLNRSYFRNNDEAQL